MNWPKNQGSKNDRDKYAKDPKIEPERGALLFEAAEEVTIGADSRKALLASSIGIIEAGVAGLGFADVFKWSIDV
jgi:hypothetical protein